MVKPTASGGRTLRVPTPGGTYGSGLFGFVDKNFSFTYTRVMTPRLTNEFRFCYLFNDNFRNTQNADLDLSSLIPGLPPITSGAGGVPSMQIAGLTLARRVVTESNPASTTWHCFDARMV